MGFVHVMRSPLGRGIRIIAGLALVVLGVTIGGAGGVALAVAGLVPLAAGTFGFCVFAPLFGADLRGNPRS